MKKQYLLLVVAVGALAIKADKVDDGRGDYKVVHSLQDVMKKKVQGLDKMIKNAMHHAVDNDLKPQYERVHRSAEAVISYSKQLDQLTRDCARKGSCSMANSIERHVGELNGARQDLYKDTMIFAEKHGEKALIEKSKEQLGDIKTAVSDFEKELKAFDQNYGMHGE